MEPPRRPAGWPGRRAGPLPLLALLGLLLWLPGILSLPPLDRDESRFAQSSRQMVETGNWVDIRFGHVPRYKKPVGIYWLQAAATAIAAPWRSGDDQIWTYRLPSLLGAIAASWLTLWCALAVTGRGGRAFSPGLLMLGTVLLTAEATIATTDAVLLACVLGVQGVLLRLYRAARDPDAPAALAHDWCCGAGRRWASASWSRFPWCRAWRWPPSLGWLAGISGCAPQSRATDERRAWAWLSGLKPLTGMLLAAAADLCPG